MKISVVIPSYKRPQILPKCLNSLKRQSRIADQVVIVLRKEDSDTRAAVLNFKESLNIKIAVVDRPGFTYAYNCGLANADGDITSFIDDDALAHEGWLKNIEKNFQQDEKVGLVTGRLINHVGGVRISEKTLLPQSKVFFPGLVIDNAFKTRHKKCYVDNPSGSNMSVRTRLMKAVGGLDNRIIREFRMELDLSFMIQRLGFKVLYDPLVIVEHYETPRIDSERFGIFTSRPEIANFNSNLMYVFLKNKGFIYKIFHVPYSFVFGSDLRTPGVLSLAFLTLIRLFNPKFYFLHLGFAIPVLKGKVAGIRKYFKFRKALKSEHCQALNLIAKN